MSAADNGDGTGQISVADLLARHGGVAVAAGGSGGRRRRAEADGGVSVTELTGEIPVIRDVTRHRMADEPDGDGPEIDETELVADEDGRAAIRQWLALATEAAAALVIGGLLFKGFGLMWDAMPGVAIALSVAVILGLVAVVRVVRRADDVLSLVIAIVVGIFVTFGPAALALGSG